MNSDVVLYKSVAMLRIFIGGGGKSPVKPRYRGSEGQKLKQFADIVHRLWLQKRSNI